VLKDVPLKVTRSRKLTIHNININVNEETDGIGVTFFARILTKCLSKKNKLNICPQ